MAEHAAAMVTVEIDACEELRFRGGKVISRRRCILHSKLMTGKTAGQKGDGNTREENKQAPHNH
jgi:hypothetical protein